MRSVFECVPQGIKFYHLRMPPIYVAYLRTYPKGKQQICCLGKRITTHAPAGSTIIEFGEGPGTGRGPPEAGLSFTL